MTGPSEVSISRIAPDLAEQSWADVQEAVVGNDPGAGPDELLCCVAVFGHGDGVIEGIERVSRAIAVGLPPALGCHVAVQAAPSADPDADTPGTLYLSCVFRPGTAHELADDIYRWTLASAIPAAIRNGARARVTWSKDDEIAAAVMTAATPPQGGVQ